MAEAEERGRAVLPVAVEWQIQVEEELDPQRGQPGEGMAAAPARLWPRQVGHWAALLLLLAFVVSYRLQETAPPASPPAFRPLAAQARSADALAAGVRQVIVTEHLRIAATGPGVAPAQQHAAAMDARYVATFALLGLPLGHGRGAPDGRLSVQLRQGAGVAWDEVAGRVLLPAPAEQPSAVVPQGEALAQSWGIALGERAGQEVADAYAVPYGWLPLLGGLRLWLLWEDGGPLSVGKTRLVRWLADPAKHELTPEDVAEICRGFGVWQLSPLDYAIPVSCEQPGHLLPSPVPLPRTLQEIAPIYPPNDSLSEQYLASQPKPSRAVSVALVLFYEYGVETFGRESLARLLGGLQAHDDWAGLIPAVYGVSAQAFEAGWQAWLAQKYGE